MPRLQVIELEGATGAAKDLLDGVHQNLGTVPNIFKGMVNSPAALNAYLEIGKALADGELSLAQREAIALVVSQENECRYCKQAHTAIAGSAGISADETLNIRKGVASDPAIRALTKFALSVKRTNGLVSDEDLSEVRAAGYTDGQIAETVVVISQTILTNLFNHVNATISDFAEVPEL